MLLTLIRHGEAVHDSVDPRRPLTPEGREEVSKTAESLKRAGIIPKLFYCSNKLRARETAEILQNILNPSGRLEEKSYLTPNSHVDTIRKDIDAVQEDLAIAGHMPFLAVLAEKLVMPEDRKEPMLFPTGGAVVLRRESGRWVIEKMVNEY
jgi:phosphohistidine phosphatase